MFHLSENDLSHHICKTLIFCLIVHTVSHYYAEKQMILIPSGNSLRVNAHLHYFIQYCPLLDL